MTEKKWEQFFDLVMEIVNGDKPYEEKKAELIKQADLKYATRHLDELLRWFDGIIEEE